MTSRKLKKDSWWGWELGLPNSAIEMFWKYKTKIISAFEQNGSSIMQYRKPELVTLLRCC